MKISDIFNRTSAYNTDKATDANKSSTADKGVAGVVVPNIAKEGEDKISISPRARQLQQIAKITGDDEQARAERVAALKAQVENGSYAVNSDEVAKAIVSFVRDNSI